MNEMDDPELASRPAGAQPAGQASRNATGSPAGSAPGAAMDPGWREALADEFAAPYMRELRAYLAARKAQRAVIYPHSSHWFQAFALTPPEQVRVVILGQDPYHGPGQAHGLSFSVPEGVRPPPSLQNIFKEIDADIGGGQPPLAERGQGCLTGWARQGVFLLNSVLTVERGLAASHQGRGWELFTDAVIRYLNDQRDHLVFFLWGSHAQKKGQIIDSRRHLVLRSAHPSPLSAHRGFVGSHHFSRANDYLQSQGNAPVDWFDVA